MKTTTLLFLAVTTLIHAEVKVSVGDVDDKRTTGQFFSGLEIKLKVAGPELAEAKGLRVALTQAVDDTGSQLQKKKNSFREDNDFQPLKKPFGGFDRDKKADEYELVVEFANPARAAKTLKLAGNIEVLVPSKDAASIVTASVAKEAGKPLAAAALKAAGVELTLEAPKGSELSYKLSDPKNAVAAIEFCSADGKPLETQGWSSSGFGGAKNMSINISGKAPADAVAKVYLLTEKSVIRVPLKLDAVALP